MFLTPKYVSLHELAKVSKINIANFGGYYENPEYRHLIGSELIKMGDSVFVYKTFPGFMKNHRDKILKYEDQLTDYTNKVPLPYLRNEYHFSEKYALAHGLGKVVDIYGKKFFEFDYDFARKHRNSAWHAATKADIEEFNDCDNIQVGIKYWILFY